MSIIKQGVELIDRDSKKDIRFSLRSFDFAGGQYGMAVVLEITNISEKPYSVSFPVIAFHGGTIKATPVKEVSIQGNMLDICVPGDRVMIKNTDIDFLEPLKYPVFLQPGESTMGFVFFKFPKNFELLSPWEIKMDLCGYKTTLTADIS